MIRAVLFDLDRTLVDRDTSIRRFFESQWQICRDDYGLLVAREPFVDRLVLLDNRGHSDKAATYATVVREFALPVEAAQRLAQDFRERFANTATLFPGALALLAALRKDGYRLGLITNGTAKVQQAKIDATGIGSLLDTILISETERIKKPKREIFDRALANLSVVGSEAIFIGDHLDVDIRGARAVGLRTIWLEKDPGQHTAEADACIASLEDAGLAIRRIAVDCELCSPEKR